MLLLLELEQTCTQTSAHSNRVMFRGKLFADTQLLSSRCRHMQNYLLVRPPAVSCFTPLSPTFKLSTNILNE